MFELLQHRLLFSLVIIIIQCTINVCCSDCRCYTCPANADWHATKWCGEMFVCVDKPGPIRGYYMRSKPNCQLCTEQCTVPSNYSLDITTIDCGNRCPIVCDPNYPYRTIDGSCNNLAHPTWGMFMTPYCRYAPAVYSKGGRPRKSVTGKPLPSARYVSEQILPIKHVRDPQCTLITMSFGQFMAHDMSLRVERSKTKCVTPDGSQLTSAARTDPLCLPIPIPRSDPVYGPEGIRYLDILRTESDVHQGCSSNPECPEQITDVSAYLDLSQIYGQSSINSTKLRAYKGGLLIANIRDGKEWPRHTQTMGKCTMQYKGDVCLEGGDERINQNPHLAIIHICFMREHNRIARYLHRLNPHWDDETVFQETRRIVIAEYQHICYYEWLPLIIGNYAYDNDIISRSGNYRYDYKPGMRACVFNEHATAAHRYFHTAVLGHLKLLGECRCPANATIRLKDNFENARILESNHHIVDELIRGMFTQNQGAADPFFTADIKHFFLKQRFAKLGKDLIAMDIHRGRDHGLPTYNDMRELLGIGRANTFEEFRDHIPDKFIRKLRRVYSHPNDVDFFVGGTLERLVPGARIGLSFLRVLIDQFYRTRVSDRFWFENFKLGFNPEQLKEIRKSSIARIISENGNDLKKMQRKGFELISKKNPLLCLSQLPEMDLSLWKEDPYSCKKK